MGHAGTLDPAATGVLPICIGQATRVVEYLSDAGKAYRATIALGLATPSYDLETAPSQLADAGELARLAALSAADLDAALRSFVGPQLQTPPMYSAIHMEGQRLYELARAGVEVEREPRPITIYRLTLLDFAPITIGDASYPALTVEVECSKGTYIRSLAVDIGAKLGVPAVLAALERTRSGPFRLADALALDALTSENITAHLYPLDYALADLTRLDLSSDDERRVRTGLPIAAEGDAAPDRLARSYSTAGRFVAILARQGGQWQPRKVFPDSDKD